MDEARSAQVEDAGEMVRLRAIMLAGMNGSAPADDGWQDESRRIIQARIAAADGTFAAFVIDQPDHRGALAACATGIVEQRLGSPGNPGGRVGYVFNVATDPAYRRRGYSRACMTALLEWFGEQGIVVVDLRASEQGEALYESLGFVRTRDPAMRLRLPHR